LVLPKPSHIIFNCCKGFLFLKCEKLCCWAFPANQPFIKPRITADEALNGSTVLHTIGLLNGASILRAHDVKEVVEAIKLHAYQTM
jgi:hypothetical protein